MDRLAHSSLLWGAPNGDFLFYGISDKNPEELIGLAKSWNYPPNLKNINGIKSSEYIQEERAYHLSTKTSEISFKIDASVKSPAVNPTFVIRNWSGRTIDLKIDGKNVERGKQFRYGSAYDTTGHKYMIVWLEMYREDSVILELGIRN